MASVVTLKTNGKPNGRRAVRFRLPDSRAEERATIRLGKISQEAAEDFARCVDALVNAKNAGQQAPKKVLEWLSELSDEIADRLAQFEVIPARHKPEAVTVATFLDEYLASRGDLKPATLTVMRQARVWLVRHLGDDCVLPDVGTADADAYKAGMVKKGLARATIAKRCRYARHFFAVALRRKLIAENPFAHIKGAVKGDPARRVFVPAETVAKVMEVLPNAQWRLLVALGRWGGLRIPSESAAMKWQDVDIPGRRFIVRASKTEHHEDGGVRVVPMFPELVPLFEQVFDQAPEGSVRVLDGFSGDQNTRTMFGRYIERAGCVAWPKPFQNLRVSRATELADLYPSHVCAAWLGHSERIADAFYRQVTDEHFAKASAGDCSASQDSMQNSVQGLAGMSRIEAGQEKQNPGKHGISGVYPHMGVIPLGLENTPDSTGKTAIRKVGAAESNAPAGSEHSGDGFDPDLDRLVVAWPELDPCARRRILKIAKLL